MPGRSACTPFVAVRVPVLFNAVLKEKIIPEYWENTKYGELYYFNYIKHFGSTIFPVPCEIPVPGPASPNQADVLLFGDSFSISSRMTTFPERLADTLGEKVFYARMDRPLTELAQQNYEKGEERILLFESAERYIPTRFTTPHVPGAPVDEQGGVRVALRHPRGGVSGKRGRFVQLPAFT
ncbi:MAG: hypothetical protein R2751_15990 [Bacteroidales bacterium]